MIVIIKDNVPHYGADRLIDLYRLIKVDAPVDYVVYKSEEAKSRWLERIPGQARRKPGEGLSSIKRGTL
jgi:hypothetical protein